ncbi:uncharacterized protein DKFZp434B061 [Antennarius striatus]|uniref:uncharacterized protein DKFZp434B061 n=1 Tax=Antennarius striatus TaxID=241820 RepID=UPI0035B0E3CF
MAVAYSALIQTGLLSQQYPPPLLPKPGKDNVKLRKLLKRTAKKKATAQASQSTTHFRSSLSPVNEASPDLEHSDHSTPPKTPETPFGFSGVHPAPRFAVRPLYHHVASPYPQRAAYNREVRLSPQMVAMPPQQVSTFFTYSAMTHHFGVSPVQETVADLVVPTISLPASSPTDTTAPASEVTKPAFSTIPESHPFLGPAAAEATLQPKHTSLTMGGQTFTRPLTVLMPLVKSKSPRPTFKANEHSRSPRPMFDVPQIRMYTASTSYYETSRTPPVYDSAGLTAIGSTVSQSKAPIEIQDLAQLSLLDIDTQRETAAETKRATPILEMHTIKTPKAEMKTVTPTSEINRSTPTSETKRATPTSEVRRATPTSEVKRATPTSEVTRPTPTSEVKRATPTSEVKRATPTSEVKRPTPTSEVKRATPTSEVKRATPTSEVKRATPTSEVKKAISTAEIRVKTPTYELQISRTSTARGKTPPYHITRAVTPVFEISKPNPLLFSVSPITVEPEKSRPSQTVSIIGISEPKPTETRLHAVAEPHHITKSKSESDLTKGNIETTVFPSQTLPKEHTTEPAASEVTSYGQQRPKTPTYEASRLLTSSPGYKRPRTPTYGTSSSGVSPVAFQRPKAPTQVAKKSGYRGLTPAEYAAHGGIKTHTPAFGISSSVMQAGEDVEAPTDESEECKIPNQEPSMKELSTAELSKVKETPSDASVPTITVSQTSDSSGATVTQEISIVSSQVVAKQKAVTQETPKFPTVVEKPTVEAQVQEAVKPATIIQDVKHCPPKTEEQDPLKAVRKLLGKDKAQTAWQKPGIEVKAVVIDEPAKAEPVAATKTENKLSKPSTAAPALSTAESTITKDTEKGRKSEPVQATSEKKEGNETLPTAEPPLKVIQKPKGLKAKMSGWSRLKKHMVVEQDEPTFPETGSQKEVSEPDQSGVKKADEKADDKSDNEDDKQTKGQPKATKMWDAVLFQMFSTKENIMHQIELNKSQEEKEKTGTTEEPKDIPSFAYRLPVLLFSPKFDAKKLKEAASRPVTKISTVFEMGLIGRKGKDEEPKDFNRTARGFTST